jgi:3-deoxy-7-phosphoheptulonate synthase
MIIKVRAGSPEEEVNKLLKTLEQWPVKIHRSEGVDHLVLGLVGDTNSVDPTMLMAYDIVEDVVRIAEPYKQANRRFHEQDTVIRIGDLQIGGGDFVIIAGPCAVESREQILTIAKAVAEAGAQMLRGGAYKPRTSPYSFQGLGEAGLDLLLEAKAETGLPIVTEIMSVNDVERFEQDVDLIQVGARNMQNFALLKELGRIHKPILLKRGQSATVEDLLMSAEYIMDGGNAEVILCERGLRTFENYSRNTLDLGAVPIIKKLSHLPVIVDPSHGSGKRFMVEPLALAAVAAGAHGIIVEVHHDPERALSDGQQSLYPEQFASLVEKVNAVQAALKPYR